MPASVWRWNRAVWSAISFWFWKQSRARRSAGTVTTNSNRNVSEAQALFNSAFGACSGRGPEIWLRA
jgi:hypothetical protein